MSIIVDDESVYDITKLHGDTVAIETIASALKSIDDTNTVSRQMMINLENLDEGFITSEFQLTSFTKIASGVGIEGVVTYLKNAQDVLSATKVKPLSLGEKLDKVNDVLHHMRILRGFLSRVEREYVIDDNFMQSISVRDVMLEVEGTGSRASVINLLDENIVSVFAEHTKAMRRLIHSKQTSDSHDVMSQCIATILDVTNGDWSLHPTPFLTILLKSLFDIKAITSVLSTQHTLGDVVTYVTDIAKVTDGADALINELEELSANLTAAHAYRETGRDWYNPNYSEDDAVNALDNMLHDTLSIAIFKFVILLIRCKTA